MKRVVLSLLTVFCMVGVGAAKDEAEIRLRDLDLNGLLIKRGSLNLTAQFDVKDAKLLDEVTFDFYLLVISRDNDVPPLFFHCQSVHRLIDEKSGHTSGVSLGPDLLSAIEPRDAQYAVVVTYKGKEVGVENSEKERWWEEASLGAPIQHMMSRFGSVPVVRTWEGNK
jgi:hypothetical protein